MDNIITRNGKPEDAKDFSRLVLLAAPKLLLRIFGARVRTVMRSLFKHRRNYFSFENSYFLEVNGETAGMALVRNSKPNRIERAHIYLLVLKYLKWGIFRQFTHLLKSERNISRFGENECYLGNIAVYPKFRDCGFGRKLLGTVEKEALKRGKARLILNAQVDNKKAIKLYKRLGYTIESLLPAFRVRSKHFQLFKMSKKLAVLKQADTPKNVKFK